jgi:hypothetical protein
MSRSSPPGRRLGSAISALFGLVYVEVNAGSLPATVMLILRILGAAAFLFVVTKLWLEAPQRATPPERGEEGFGSRYWLIVALEAAGIVVGSALLRRVGLGAATVAWVSVVVGVHFLALAAVWRMSLLRRLGVAIALCGTAAIAAAEAGAAHGWVAGVGGVLPGALLLWAATRGASGAPAPCPQPPGSAAACRD